MARALVIPVAFAMLLVGCASQPMPAPGHERDFSRAVGQPLRDLSVIREIAPPVLRRAAVAPYETATLADCRAIAAELVDLDAVLGPDLSSGHTSSGVDVHGMAADLIEGAVGLPFRGVVRQVTGARGREQALKAAVLAGMVRRGFAKGRASTMGCGPGPPQATVIPPSIM